MSPEISSIQPNVFPVCNNLCCTAKLKERNRICHHFHLQYLCALLMPQKLRIRSTADGVDPMETLHHYMGNLMNDLVFGKVYQEDDEVWRWLRHLQEEGVKHIGVAGPLNFLSWLRYSVIPDMDPTRILRGSFEDPAFSARRNRTYRFA